MDMHLESYLLGHQKFVTADQQLRSRLLCSKFQIHWIVLLLFELPVLYKPASDRNQSLRNLNDLVERSQQVSISNDRQS